MAATISKKRKVCIALIYCTVVKAWQFVDPMCSCCIFLMHLCICCEGLVFLVIIGVRGYTWVYVHATGLPILLQFVSDGVFKAELNDFLQKELAEDGYSGVEVRVTPTKTEIIILATRTQNVLGEKGRRIRELTALVQKRFNYQEGTVEVSTVGRMRS